MATNPAHYWRFRTQRYRLEGDRCDVCGRAAFPPRPVCACAAVAAIMRDLDLQQSPEAAVEPEHRAPALELTIAPLILALPRPEAIAVAERDEAARQPGYEPNALRLFGHG